MLMKPAWLVELHRQWIVARGSRAAESQRSFHRRWPRLLDDAGIHKAEDIRTAERELKALVAQEVLDWKWYQRRFVERITVRDEAWLLAQFGSDAPKDLLARSLDHVAKAREKGHPRLPSEWDALCQQLTDAFTATRSLSPFRWRAPESVRELLDIIHGLTAQEWPFGVLIRDLSSTLGFDSKKLEKHQTSIERALSLLLGAETRYKSLGIVTGDAMIRLSGPITLHFADGSSEELRGTLRGPIEVSATDLERATRITTTAARLLTIENRKTTFRLIADANSDRQTLLAATSFPSPAFREFLTKLPRELPHYHFGDTDPSGWLILEKLREASPRPVEAFRMQWRPATLRQPLTPHDLTLLPKLLASPLLADVKEEIGAMVQNDDRGAYEQESLGPPHRDGWPFFA